MLPGDLLERTEVVAGPATGGALLAHTMAGLLDGRRALTHPPCELRAVHVRRRPAACCADFYARQHRRPARAAGRRRAEYRADVPALRRAGAARPAESCIATVEICDRLEAVAGLDVTELRAGRVPGAGELSRPADVRCAGRRADHHASDRDARHAPSDTLRRLAPIGGSIASTTTTTAKTPPADPVHLVRPFATGRSRSGGVLRRGAGVRPGRERASHSIRTLFRIMGPHPAALRARVRSAARRIPSCGRWCTAGRAASISPRCCGCCGRCSSESGSIERFFAEGLTAGDVDVGPALDRFSRARARARHAARSTAASPKRPGVCYFFPRPVHRQRVQAAEPLPALDGAPRRSRSRRVAGGPPARLIVPLDTHVIRLSRACG